MATSVTGIECNPQGCRAGAERRRRRRCHLAGSQPRHAARVGASGRPGWRHGVGPHPTGVVGGGNTSAGGGGRPGETPATLGRRLDVILARAARGNGNQGLCLVRYTVAPGRPSPIARFPCGWNPHILEQGNAARSAARPRRGAYFPRLERGCQVSSDQDQRSPNGRRRPAKRTPLGTGRPTPSFWLMLGLVVVIGLAQAYFWAPQGDPISYSQFKSLLRDGRVADVAISDQTIRGTLKPKGTSGAKETSFTTTRIEDPKLVEDLDKFGANYRGEIASRWLPELIGWLLPVALILLVSSYFFRRMGSPDGGAMSFARSRSKVYAEDDVKVSFDDVAGVDEAKDELREIVEFLKTPRSSTNLGGTDTEGRPAGRPARHRQDAAGTSGRRRGQGTLLQSQRLRVRRDVRRRRGGARPRPVRAGPGEGPLHRLHRRAGRAGQDARA